MLTLRDYVNWGIAHSDIVGKAEGVPLVMEKCKRGKKMKQLEVYGESMQDGTPSPEAPVEFESVGELVTDIDNENYGKYKIPVTVRGKNLFDCSSANSLYNGYVSANTIERTVTGCAWTPHNTASFVHLDLGFASYYVGKTLVASFDADVQNEETFNDTAFVVCDDDGSNRKSLTGSHVWDNGHFYVRSSLAEEDYGEKHLTLRLYMRDAIAYQTYEFKNIMVAESDTDIPFEPYIEPVTTDIYLNEPLRKIGEYADVLDFQKKRVIRNTYCNILDGTGSTGSLSLFNTGSFTGLRVTYRGDMLKYVMPKDKGLQVSHYGLCNRYPVVSTAYRADCTLSGSTTAMNIFDIIDSDFLSVEDWTDHMKALNDAGTPIRVVHAVATPYEEAITCELPTLVAKTTVIDIGTGIQPSNIKGKYIKR